MLVYISMESFIIETSNGLKFSLRILSQYLNVEC